VGTLRRNTISKIFALWIIGLILMPFTAPFKTYDLAGVRTPASRDGLPKDKTAPDEKLTDQSDASLIPPSLDEIVIRPHTRHSQNQSRQPQTRILRL
jgi:hypothetical protein